MKRLHIPANVAEKALDEMYGAIKDIEALVKGYSHFFLEDPLAFLMGNAIEVAPDKLLQILQVVGSIISMGPQGEIDHEKGDKYTSLNNHLWCCTVMFLLVSMIWGCIHTRDLPSHCNFPISKEDIYRVETQLQQPATQLEAI